ncbi:MAG: hypothetical protein M1838_006065 [Thelocarpon superellum]|nr:MAG: hypothetical protein M1838_006065 [Thelocarpon superellum]
MASSTPTSILVLGAGELGMAVLRGLVKHSPPSTSITVLLQPFSVHSPSPAKAEQLEKIRSLGVALLPGDLVASSAATLADLFRPYHLIIGCTGFAVGGTGLQLKLCQAVLAANVPKYIPWQFGVDYDIIGRGSGQDLFDEQIDVRDLIRGQTKTKWVIISTGMFTSFVFEREFGVVNMGEGRIEGSRPLVRALGGWDTEVTLTTPEDIGDLTARVVWEAPEVTNRIVYTAGDTISYERLANVVEEVMGTEVRRELWDVDFLQRELDQHPDDSTSKYRLVFARGHGVAWPVETSFNAQKKIDVTEVERWARENLGK